MITILAGLSAGLLHVLSGPDHLAAIAPISVKFPRRSWVAGFRWGLGHSAGVLVIGLLFLLLRDFIPVDFISNSSDRLVGLLLIGIGVWSFRKAFRIHSHTHLHAGAAHEHIHLHGPREEAQETHAHAHAAFGIGTLHGLAGSAHFLGILPALALPSNALAASYLLAFGAGTVLAMILFSTLIGQIAQRFSIRNVNAYRGLMFACAAAATGIGCVWITGHAF